jgi:hypothetical protein
MDDDRQPPPDHRQDKDGQASEQPAIEPDLPDPTKIETYGWGRSRAPRRVSTRRKRRELD